MSASDLEELEEEATITRAIPVWPGLGPWGQAAAQFSYHEARPDGSYSHLGWLAEGPQDARPELARVMVGATLSAERIVTYSGFEKTRVRALQKAVPELEAELIDLEAKLIDLLPVVKNFVYHPHFEGSFSIKYVLRPLVPELGYNDLVIVDGLVALSANLGETRNEQRIRVGRRQRDRGC